MKRMKFLTLTLGLCMLSSLALAENPVNWTFSNVTSGNGTGLCGHWDSTGQDTLDNGYDAYDYLMTFTKIELEYNKLFGGTDWMDVVSFVGNPPETGAPSPLQKYTIGYVDPTASPARPEYFTYSGDTEPTKCTVNQLEGPFPISMETIIDQSVSETGVEINVYARIVMSVGTDGIMNIDVYDQNISGTLYAQDLTGNLRISGTTDMSGTTVPEPCTMAILGAAGVAIIARRRRK